MNDFIKINLEIGGKSIFMGTVSDLSYNDHAVYRLINGLNQQDLAFSFQEAIRETILKKVKEVLDKND